MKTTFIHIVLFFFAVSLSVEGFSLFSDDIDIIELVHENNEQEKEEKRETSKEERVCNHQESLEVLSSATPTQTLYFLLADLASPFVKSAHVSLHAIHESYLN